nr:MBOAT family O-acyltransferase [Legionella jamestowniensis]
MTLNLSTLVYFKYFNFLCSSSNYFFNTTLPYFNIILPIGISFFTFTQIAFLVDVYKGQTSEYNFIHYLLFITYFPHLIAGPVLHHKQIIPQFMNPNTYTLNTENVAVGLTLFIFGLVKKVLIADSLSTYVIPIFNAANQGVPIAFVEAWIGSLSYTFQIYFDFSGYSDMAIGLSLLFNIRLPMNFNSPYKATSIIDFWRRWHISLSTFLRDYLYIPLGGNKKGTTRRFTNLLITMLLGGLWHGAGWTFVIWGGLHGLYLIINHFWKALTNLLSLSNESQVTTIISRGLTFLAVIVAWVFFRAESFSSAVSILSGMIGLNGISLPRNLHLELLPYIKIIPVKLTFSYWMPACKLPVIHILSLILLSCLLVWFFPNTRELLKQYKPTWEDIVSVKLTALQQKKNGYSGLLTYELNPWTALIMGMIFSYCLLHLTTFSEFIYFQF